MLTLMFYQVVNQFIVYFLVNLLYTAFTCFTDVYYGGTVTESFLVIYIEVEGRYIYKINYNNSEKMSIHNIIKFLMSAARRNFEDLVPPLTILLRQKSCTTSI